MSTCVETVAAADCGTTMKLSGAATIIGHAAARREGTFAAAALADLGEALKQENLPSGHSVRVRVPMAQPARDEALREIDRTCAASGRTIRIEQMLGSPHATADHVSKQLALIAQRLQHRQPVNVVIFEPAVLRYAYRELASLTARFNGGGERLLTLRLAGEKQAALHDQYQDLERRAAGLRKAEHVAAAVQAFDLSRPVADLQALHRFVFRALKEPGTVRINVSSAAAARQADTLLAELQKQYGTARLQIFITGPQAAAVREELRHFGPPAAAAPPAKPSQAPAPSASQAEPHTSRWEAVKKVFGSLRALTARAAGTI